jgi:hypothetical protein
MYSGSKAILTSKHQKLAVIAPAFTQIGLELIELPLDTDQLGTFSGEVERLTSPLETALAKARMGMVETGEKLGIASEGSIGPDPVIPFAISNIEVMVFVDEDNGLEISETFRSLEISHGTTKAAPFEDLTEFLAKVGFPNQALIVRPDSEAGAWQKGIDTQAKLTEAITLAAESSANSLAHIECDYRAMYSASRRANIALLAENLASRVGANCPNCKSPGWGKLEFERGLNCSGCGEFDATAVRAELNACVRCDYTELKQVVGESLKPASCQLCNP